VTPHQQVDGVLLASEVENFEHNTRTAYQGDSPKPLHPSILLLSNAYHIIT